VKRGTENPCVGGSIPPLGTTASHDIQTGVSIGIAFYPEHGKDIAELIHNADQTMYQSRKENKCFAFAG